MNFNNTLSCLVRFFVSISAFTFGSLAEAKIKVVTTIPELAYAASAIGGDLVEARSLLRGTENPHFVDAVPEFTRLTAEADIVCVVGLDLEIGYMPAVLSRSGNAKVQPGGNGYCEAGKGVKVLDKPTGRIDRSMGDVHPSGNPHFFLSPKALADSASEIAATLVRTDPTHAPAYQKGLADFRNAMAELDKEVEQLLAPLKKLQMEQSGRAVVLEYHREFAYFLADHSLSSFGSIEEKPGVPPSAGRLAEVAIAAKNNGVRVVLAADYFPKKTLDRFEELSGIGVAIVPTMMQQGTKLQNYADLQRHIARSLISAASKPVQGH